METKFLRCVQTWLKQQISFTNCIVIIGNFVIVIISSSSSSSSQNHHHYHRHYHPQIHHPHHYHIIPSLKSSSSSTSLSLLSSLLSSSLSTITQYTIIKIPLYLHVYGLVCMKMFMSRKDSQTFSLKRKDVSKK